MEKKFDRASAIQVVSTERVRDDQLRHVLVVGLRKFDCFRCSRPRDRGLALKVCDRDILRDNVALSAIQSGVDRSGFHVKVPRAFETLCKLSF